MSASLVGSEMCIRDRPGPAEWGSPTFADSEPRRGPVGPLGVLGGRGPPAVSYTHLTLPTICSV
eukprot:13464574-Alexandrium_andersonii.AAC.1